MVNTLSDNLDLAKRASAIRMLITDNDGVLTDAGVYYSPGGEELKRYSMRDGMGVERLRKVAGVDVAIITGENSPLVAARAAKLEITEVHLGIKDKRSVFEEILHRYTLEPHQVAYIGDDLNDLQVMQVAGLSACPQDAFPQIVEIADYVCRLCGGYGAFREFAEVIIAAKSAHQSL